MIKKIKEFKKALKEKKHKTLIYIVGILLLLNLGACIYFIYNLSLLNGIEDIIRYGIMILAAVMVFAFGIFAMNSIIKGKIKRYLAFIILILLSICAQGFIGYNIGEIYRPISGINKSVVTYTTDLITMKSSDIEKVSDIKKVKIGIISKSKALEDYTIGQEILKDNKLKSNNTVKEYNDYFEMLNDLYEGKIDCMFVSSNYAIMFSTYEKFANVKDEVKVITSKSKDFKKKETSLSSNKNIIKEPFTVLLMGVDSETDGLDKNAAFNGDSLMLITFNPTTLNTTVLSIPRDTYVPIMCFKNQKQNKITHAAWYGVDCMQKTIENFTGVKIDYYVKMNFKGVVNLVDALGGIDVDVPFKFCEQNSDRAWGNQTICLSPGEQHLNGEQALALARHRKTLALGDIQRGLNQQIVIQGMLQKLTSINSLDKVNSIMNTISKNMDTNISTNQILSFYNVGKDILLKSANTTTTDLISMEKLYLDGYTDMIYDDAFKAKLSDYIYYKSSLNAVVDAMNVNLGKKEATMEKTFDFSINEVYEKQIIGKGKKDSTSKITTLPNFIGKSKSYVTSWCNARNIKVSFTTVSEGDRDYKSSYDDGEIISQSISSGTDIKKVSSITFKVISKPKDTTTNNNNTNNNNNTSPTELPITFSHKQTTINLSIGEKKYNPAGITIKEGTKDVTYDSNTYICSVGPYNSPGKYEVTCKASYKKKEKEYKLTIIVGTGDNNESEKPDTGNGDENQGTEPNPGDNTNTTDKKEDEENTI